MKASKLLWIPLAVVVLLFLGRTGSSQTAVALDSASPLHVSLKLTDPYAAAYHSMAPIVHKDANSGIVLYVESDHQHVSAISEEGKVLWSRSPITDAFHDSFRPRNSGIVAISASADGKHAVLSCGSLSGTVDLATGDPEPWSWISD